MTHVKREWKEKTIMSKTGAWALDHKEKEQELPTFKVTEKYVMEDTWIVQAKNSTDAWNIAMTQDPDNEERGMKLSDDVEELE